MPWLKASDAAATHPLVQRARARKVPTQHVETFGFVVLCAVQSAAHLTDYFVGEGTVWSVAGPEEGERMARNAVRAGMLKPARVGGQRGWLIVEDEDFLHVRRRDEVEWERQRNADRRNPDLTMPVRLRDGDGCRYCGVIVNWADRRSGRSGTYDHREPGKPATIDTYVVACRSCNSARKDNPLADQQLPLLPVPSSPYYSESTAKVLAAHGYGVTPSPSRPGSQPDTASPRPRAKRDTAPPRPGSQPDTAPRDPADGGTPRQLDDAQPPGPPEWFDPDQADPPDPEGGRPGRAGSGRDGSGRAGTAPDARRRRARRGTQR